MVHIYKEVLGVGVELGGKENFNERREVNKRNEEWKQPELIYKCHSCQNILKEHGGEKTLVNMHIVKTR